MAKMKLFAKKDAEPGKEKKTKGNILKKIGIASGILWVTAVGAVFAIKDMDLSPAGTHDKEGAEADGHHDEGAEGETALAHVPAGPKDDHGHGEEAGHGDAHGKKDDGHHGEADHAEAHGEADHGKAGHHEKADHGHAAAPEDHEAKDHGHDKPLHVMSIHGKKGHEEKEKKHEEKAHGDEHHAEADHGKADHHAKEAHGEKDAHAKDHHGKDAHAKDAHAKDSHGKDAHADAHGKEAHAKKDHGDHGDSHDKAHAKAHPAKDAHDSHGDHAEKASHAAPAKKAPAVAHSEEEDEAEEVAVVGPGSEDERNALRELAEIHASNGNLDRAVYPLRKLMAAPTKDVALLSLATEVFLGTGRYKDALNAANKALRYASPGRVDLHVAAAMSRYRLGQVSEAMADAKAALNEHPKDLDLLTALGTMEMEQGPSHPDYGKSLAKALKVKPTHVPALYQLGRKAQLEGDYKDAEVAFRKVLKLDPKHSKAHGQLGTALYHLEKDAPAKKEFEAALAINPKDYNTWFNLGELQLNMASKEAQPASIRALRTEALASYLKAVEWNRDHAEAHFRIGVILNGNAQYKEALRHLEASRKADASHVPTLVQMAVAYENLKKPDQARAHLEKALELDPSDKIVMMKLRLLSRLEPGEGA